MLGGVYSHRTEVGALAVALNVAVAISVVYSMR